MGVVMDSMDFEEWWDEVGHNLWCDNDDIFLSDLVKAAWEEASMDAYSRGFKAAKEIDSERVAYMEDKVRELERDLKYWQDKVLNEEYDKTLTGDRAV